MAPKKKEQQKMSLGDFMADSGFGGGSWADEVEETSVIGTQALPASDRSRMGGGFSSYQDRGYSVRESVPQRFPDKPPYTAHLGNLSYEATNETVTEFFDGCEVASVRIIEDRELMRPKGFGYVEFATADGLRKALDLDGQSFQGRMIKIKIADPPRGGEGGRQDGRDMDWTRKGPLADAPGPVRGGRQPSDFGERRPRDPEAEPRPQRDLNWGERRGPLAPLQQEPGSGFRGSSRPRPAAEGMGERSESYRGGRPAASWGEGRPTQEEGGRPRREFTERPERPERPERTATAADQDMKWRERMRPDAAAETPSPSGETSTPASPALSNAAPAVGGRPKLNLAKRTVSEATDLASPSGGDSKASPFGAARPIDTRTREKEVEEKRQQAIAEKKEAEEKAKEERRLAKEAAAAKAAEAEANEVKSEEAPAGDEAKAADVAEDATVAPAASQNGDAREQKLASRPREPRDAPKSRAAEAGSWRSASFEGGRGGRGGAGPRGGRGGAPGRGGRDGPRGEGRGPRANGPPSQPATPTSEEPPTPTVDEDGWTTVTVPKKGRTVRS